jgi:two-component system, chemotaxis family, sensor kinase Cph1
MLENTVDFLNCDLEPIHVPGSIQPHGVLLVLQDSTLEILQVSSNTQAIIGLHHEELLGKPLSALLGVKQFKLIQRLIAEDFESINPLNLSIKNLNRLVYFDGIVHRVEKVIILELEPKKTKDKADFFNFYQQVRGSITRVQKAATLLDMCQIVVKEVRRLADFDRVMVYRFDQDGSGCVIAEDTNQEMSYLDFHYPSSDIPKSALQLYTFNWLRLIPTANYEPVALIPENNPLTNQPLDLSLSVLRSVSPFHMEYLQNMGVDASMSISLMQDKKLWGLIACHHSSPKYVSYKTRTMCEFIAQVMSVELVNKEATEHIEYKRQLKYLQTQFIEALSQAKYFLRGMLQLESQLLNLVSATGAVIWSGNECIRVGKTPSEEVVYALLNWIKPHLKDNLFETSALSKEFPTAESFKAIVSGVLALEISRAHHNYILWFRPEVLQTVKWAGNPSKPVELSQDGSLRMSPRKSFELWKETVRGSALQWKPYEIESVSELRSLIVGIVLRQADEIALMNSELKRSNEDLDSFAYIASHDLKEPLRGIHNYANLLMEGYAEILDENGVSKLQTLVRLTQRMEGLINSVLYFSRLGSANLKRQTVNLNELVQQVINTVSIARPVTNIEFRIPRTLPSTQCDQAQVSELFTNLLSNAIKYNNKEQKWIEIGFIPESKQASESYPLTFYVRDNGIGIPQEHFDKIFQIFRRLHDRDDFGGGTGVGLTIARRIVERHGGKMWIDSILDQGSTFYFKLSAETSV